MEDYIAIAEDQLDQWRQTGQRDLLHRGLSVLTSQLQEQGQAKARHNEIMTELKLHRERFEAIDKRFEAVDNRFEELIHHLDKRFEANDRRFEAVDKRFEDLIHHLDKRFESNDKRFSQLSWTIGIGFTMIVTLMTLYNFL